MYIFHVIFEVGQRLCIYQNALRRILEFYLNHNPLTLYSHIGEAIARPVALGEEGGCDPTSLKLDGSRYSELYKVGNVNNVPKLLPTKRNGAGDMQNY